jgi:hypothetical protein
MSLIRARESPRPVSASQSLVFRSFVLIKRFCERRSTQIVVYSSDDPHKKEHRSTSKCPYFVSNFVNNVLEEIFATHMDDMIADYMTKPLQGAKFLKFKKLISENRRCFQNLTISKRRCGATIESLFASQIFH